MSRHAGLHAWMLQRLSALYLATYSGYLLLHFARQAPADYQAWQAWVATPAIGISAALFFLALLLHVWVGLRDILMDYVRTLALRLSLTALLLLGLVACGLWALRILWKAGYAG
jgi:succinate dehydrogenase / fumarate reductase, membrane anchor subunit